MLKKNNISKIEKELKKGVKMVAMVAPSFVAEFEYPSMIHQLKDLGFDKVVELTFGAKMINREYHKILKNSKGLIISSACAGVVETIKNKYPQYKKNLVKVDSPMTATGKICKKLWPKHKTVFISPCEFKKIEAGKSKHVDYVIDYEQLRELFKKNKIKKKRGKVLFDKFYNDYTKIYPLSGGLGKTAQIRKILKKDEILTIEGIKEIMKFLDKPDPKIRFLDILFCVGGCIGGPHTSKKLTIPQKRKKVLNYLELAKTEDIPKTRKGVIENAKGIKFTRTL
ncbi:hypothetical protein GOV13_05060 [Candidatus Pacearchaeota archaeon]|nr:hypothetical protein [Candidatus Pacearchaeota archaeon]